MYIAMNRFKVPSENAEEFEALWLGRDSHLKDMEGFVEFHMLKGPEAEDGTVLFASHTVWADEDSFRAWTRSDAFREAHKNAGTTRQLYVGAPQFEGFTTIQHLTR
ncbi:MAG: antibiotic biosynthesis monooxygenase [Rhodobacteraceae bacterium]|nr:antibiotic biosynthesis monooxygenase [Paracoccaceae bacterium]